ncbi:hypothetical protein CDAR_483701 [Caerostris darwini]|uniref:Uncharacterized protein n=1 Tax=Caerostris darwini TaxID=1538125 RepID=A0AAV4TSG8_9ARAC|nr:hypothetical protein CDAR_483701 [Caerostris darwini]
MNQQMQNQFVDGPPCYANLQPDETVAMTTQEMTFLHLFLSLFLPVLVCQKFANPFPRRTWAPCRANSCLIIIIIIIAPSPFTPLRNRV